MTCAHHDYQYSYEVYNGCKLKLSLNVCKLNLKHKYIRYTDACTVCYRCVHALNGTTTGARVTASGG